MFKKSLAVLAVASFVAVGACSSSDSSEDLGADTLAVPAAAPAPVVTDTAAAPIATDTGFVTTDSVAADTVPAM